MADGEKFILEQWADAFDRMRLERMHRLDESNQQRIQELYQLHGYGDWTTPGQRAVHEAALGMGLKYAFLEVSSQFLGSYVDVLRLGEVVRKPSVGAAVRDGLRLVTLVPFAGVAGKLLGKIPRVKTYIELKRLEVAAQVPGTPSSCGPTGMTRALILSGTKMYARISDVMKGIKIGDQQMTEAYVLSKEFEGIESLKSFIPRLQRLGMHFKSVLTKPVSEDLGKLVEQFNYYEQIVKTTGNPILVLVKQSKATTKIEPHVLLMYRDAKGAVKFADPGSFTKTADEVIYFYDTISEAYQVSNTAILHPAAIPALNAAAKSLAGNNRSSFWIDLLGVPMYVVDQNFMDSVEIGVKRRLKELKAAAAPSVAPPVLPRSAEPTPKLKTFAGLTAIRTSIPATSESPAVNLTIYEYKIKTGDTLFGLAQRYYGNADKYKFIQAANADILMRLKGDQQLPVGRMIIIPGN